MKKFLIIGGNCNIIYSNVFPMVQKNKLWIGYTSPKIFYTDTKLQKKFGNICWYQSLKNNIDRPKLELTKYYNQVYYPKYDNYDAIEVSKTKNIPIDYTGLMGVPITFLDKYNPEQFEIICSIRPVINGKDKFARLIIRNKHPVSTENTVNDNVDE